MTKGVCCSRRACRRLDLSIGRPSPTAVTATVPGGSGLLVDDDREAESWLPTTTSLKDRIP